MTSVTRTYSPLNLQLIADEARQLVEKGTIDRRQSLYVLCRYFPPREWIAVETELEFNGFLMRDLITDLIGDEQWTDD